ncbi:DUF6640 family protein [Planomicrobium sp. CPCC 101079]|uniref:DUF6640 family protein n=1 Tax=Planomicrobium sp. CPCC 101079 TaxID=2599618 RepID=UPI0011B650D1|nr:DUF6640 family protein [Planomicrobium sp. CPCC 101079]TWT09289.1 hypothetical protein FQV28_06550 [Planomicrobium sp. CPCC 101079]
MYPKNSIDLTGTSRTGGKKISVGKVILGTAAGLTAVGGFLADWNRTHLFNPNWPPHAKFHDGMSITLGFFLGSASLYFLFRTSSAAEQDIKFAAMLPAFFWSAMAISSAYPGAKGMEAEFPELVPRIGGIWLNEKFAATAMLGTLAAGYELMHKEQSI